MLFLDDLKITNKKIFIFGIFSSYSKYLITNFVHNEINIDIWDLNKNWIIKNKDKEEYKNKYLAFVDPLDINFNIEDYEYFVISSPLKNNDKYFNFFNKKDLQDKVCSDFDILLKIHPNLEFTGILGNYGKNIFESVLNHIKNESKLELINNNTEEFKRNIPIIFSYEKIKYIKNSNFNTIIVYDDNKEYFLNKDNLRLINNTILNKEAIKLIINIDNINLKNMYEKLQKNKNFIGTLIPISVSKILNNGISFVNGTIYDYYNANLNYDLIENDIINNSFIKLVMLISYIYNKEYKILEDKNIIQCLSTYSGEQNIFEKIKDINNIQIINNIGIDSEELLKLAFKTYDNIYLFCFVNSNIDKEKIRFFENNSKIIFYIDKYNLLEDKIDNIFIDEKKAFEKLYSLCLLENKEDKITILISASSINININFDKELENIKDIINNVSLA